MRWCCLLARPRRRMSRLVSAWRRAAFGRRCDRGLSRAQNPQDSSREPTAIPKLVTGAGLGAAKKCAGVISHLLVAPIKQGKSQAGRRCGGGG